MEGKSPVPLGHSYANPTRRIISEQKQTEVQFEPADLTKVNFTSDLSMSVRVKSPPGSRPVPVQPSSDRAHVLPGIHATDGNPLQTYDDQRFQTWEDIKREGRVSPRNRDYYQGSTPVLYLGISCIRDETPPPPPHPKSPVVIKVTPAPPPEIFRKQEYYPLGTPQALEAAAKLQASRNVAPPPQQPARAPSAAMGDATVMRDHPVLYETTVYEQAAAHSPRPSASTLSYLSFVPLSSQSPAELEQSWRTGSTWSRTSDSQTGYRVRQSGDTGPENVQLDSSQRASMVDYGPQGPVNEVTQRDQYMEFHTGKTEYGAENVLSFHDLHPYYTQDARHETEDPKYRDPNEGTLSHWFAQAQSTLAGITSPQK